MTNNIPYSCMWFIGFYLWTLQTSFCIDSLTTGPPSVAIKWYNNVCDAIIVTMQHNGGNSNMRDTVRHPMRWMNKYMWGPLHARDGYALFWANHMLDKDFLQIHLKDLKNWPPSYCPKMLKNSNQIQQCFFFLLQFKMLSAINLS
jgi:hypothetical protein